MIDPRRLRSFIAYFLIACLLADPRLVWASSAPSAHPLLSFTEQALAAPAQTDRTSIGPGAQEIRVFAEQSLGVGLQGLMQAVPTIGLNVTAEDDETRTKPAVREAMGEGRSLTIFNKGEALADDIPAQYRDLVPGAIRAFHALDREDLVRDLEDTRIILIQPKNPQLTRAPPSFLWFDSFAKYMVADAGRGPDHADDKKQRQVYIPQALVDRLLKAGEVYLLHDVIRHEARHAHEKFNYGYTTEDESELQQLRHALEPYLLADLEDWIGNLVTDAHGLSSSLDEVTQTLSDLKRLAESLPPSERTTEARRHLYQSVIRAFGLIAYESWQGDPGQQDQVVELAMGHLTDLGAVSAEQISWIKTLRNARRNLERIKNEEIEVNLALLQIPDPDIVQDRNRARFMDNRRPDTLVGRLKYRVQMAMSATAYQTGSGYGIFQTIEMIRKQFPNSRHAEAQRQGKIILNLLALSSGYGTRAGLLNVASFLDKGAIDLFDRTGMEQSMEQVLQLLGDPNLGKGLPPGEYFMVVPADNILLPDHNVADYYQRGQGAFLYALRRPVVGVDVGALNAISEFGLVQVGPDDMVSRFIEKPKRGREADRLKILTTVLSQSIANHDSRQNVSEETYDHLWRLIKEADLVWNLPMHVQNVFELKRLEMLLLPALLSKDVFYSLRGQLSQTDRWLGEYWDAAWDMHEKLIRHDGIRQLLQGIVDDAYLNTFYFLMSRPFVDSLWSTYDGKPLDHSDPPNKSNFWKIFRRAGEGDTKFIDWSILVLGLPTLRGTNQQDTLPGSLSKIYSPNDIRNLTLFDIEALKEAMVNPTFKESQKAFMKEWMKRSAAASPLRLGEGDQRETWRQIGQACFDLLAPPGGALFSRDALAENLHMEFTDRQYHDLKENALDVLQKIGARWAVVKFGTFWQDRGDPKTAWATLQEANSKNIIRQMVARLHFGLRLRLRDVSDDSVIEGNVRFLGQHTVNRSVILAPPGGSVVVGDNFVANHSVLDFRHLPSGTVVKLASGIVVDHTDIPQDSMDVIGRLALSKDSYIYRLYGEAGMSNQPEYKEEVVMSTLFRKRNSSTDQERTDPRAVSHALLDAEQMRAELNHPLDGLELGEELTLQNIYDMRGKLIDWKAQLEADKALTTKLEREIISHRRLAALNPVEAHGFFGLMGFVFSAAVVLHAPVLVLFALAPWMITALGQEAAVITHAVYERDWRILLSVNPIATYDFNRQQEFGSTSTFAHAQELARALLQTPDAYLPRLISPLTLLAAVVDDVVTGLLEGLLLLLPASWKQEAMRAAKNPLPSWRPDLTFRENVGLGLQAVWQNLNSRKAASEFDVPPFFAAAA